MPPYVELINALCSILCTTMINTLNWLLFFSLLSLHQLHSYLHCARNSNRPNPTQTACVWASGATSALMCTTWTLNKHLSTWRNNACGAAEGHCRHCDCQPAARWWRSISVQTAARTGNRCCRVSSRCCMQRGGGQRLFWLPLKPTKRHVWMRDLLCLCACMCVFGCSCCRVLPFWLVPAGIWSGQQSPSVCCKR